MREGRGWAREGRGCVREGRGCVKNGAVALEKGVVFPLKRTTCVVSLCCSDTKNKYRRIGRACRAT